MNKRQNVLPFHRRLLQGFLAALLALYMCLPYGQAPALTAQAAEADSATTEAADTTASSSGASGADAASGSSATDTGESASTNKQSEDNQAAASAESSAGDAGNGKSDSDASDSAGSGGSTGAASSSEDGSSDTVDLTERWESGDATVNQSGTYTLTGDVKATQPLHVALPEGASATIDLAGHDVVVSGSANSAIDLSDNAGTVEFIDSAFDSQNADNRSSITLKSSDANAAVAVVRDLRTYATHDAFPSATFKNIHLAVKAEAASAKSYKQAVAVVQTGLADERDGEDDADWTAKKVAASVTLDGCALTVSAATTDAFAKTLDEGQNANLKRGTVSLVEANCAGITLSGRTSASTVVDGDPVSGSTATVRSAYASTYTIGEDFALAVPENDKKSFASSLVFGYPSKAKSGGAVVAVAENDNVISNKAAKALKAASGYVATLVKSEDDEGYSQLKLTKDASDDESQNESAASAATGSNAASGTTDSASSEKDDNASEGTKASESQSGASDGAASGADDEFAEDDSDTLAVDEAAAAKEEQAAAQAEAAAENAAAQVAPADRLLLSAKRLMSTLSTASTTNASAMTDSANADTASSAATTTETADADDEVEGTDINEAWAAQTGGVSSAYTITEGGTYYLSDDLTAKSSLTIDAAGQDVTIKLNGHKLILNGTGSASRKTMLTVTAANSVTIDGASSSGAQGTIQSAGSLDVRAIASTAQDCALTINDVELLLTSTSNTQRNLSTHAVSVSAGSLAMTRCTVLMDMANQALASSSLLADNSPEVPSAVYATSGADSVELADCIVQAHGPQGFALSSIDDLTTIGNAYAVYSKAGQTTVRGGSYTAESLRGNATCLFASSLDLELGSANDQVELEADAGQLATGILSTAASSAHINAPFQFTVGSSYEGAAQAEVALRASVENGFVFGDCAPSDAARAYPVLVMTGSDLQAANAEGARIGTFDAALSDDARAAVTAGLANALTDGACTVSADDQGVLFQLDAANAVASIDSGSGQPTYYGTIDAALQAFSNGDTLTLLKDAGAVAVLSAASGTLDLNGHTITSLDFSTSTKGTGLLVKNGSIRGSLSISGAKGAVYQHAASPLTLEDVDIAVAATNANAYGVYGGASAGALSFTGSTSITVALSRYNASAGGKAYGVYLANKGPELAMDGTKVSVSTSSADVAVYGVYSTVSAELSDCDFSITGTTGTSCAVYAGGTLTVSGSTLDTYTTGVAGTAVGIWARTSNPKATDVSVDASSITVRSALSDVSAGTYACLLGATGETGTAAPSGAWHLSGQNTFVSAGGVHMGLNVGDIKVSDDFSLSGTSDSPLVVSQSARTGNVGITVTGSNAASRAQELATLFTAKSGSYYDGFQLAVGASDAQSASLVWRPAADADGQGLVAVEHDGAATRYATFAEALEAAQSGDTVRLLADLSESGAQTVTQDNLTIDLNGHTLSVRARDKAKTSSTGWALGYRGSGTLTIANGTLAASFGVATEPAAGSIYQGVAVTGGGTLNVSSDAAIQVSYTGSTSSSAAQQAVTMRGIAVAKGTLNLEGALSVKAATADGAIGANTAYGIYAAPASGAEAAVTVASGATVNVDVPTGVIARKNNYFNESSSLLQGGPSGLREITVDPENDPDLYQEILRQFRLSASYDDPDESGSGSSATFGTRIYYAQPLTLQPEDTSAWYYGMKVWAFSDEVSQSDVGKMSAIVPTHFFVSSGYDTLTDAYGIATGSSAAGTANIQVTGTVTATAAHGNATALDAEGSSSGQVTWNTDGATLSATADPTVHALAGSSFDLRDYINFSTTQSKRVAYSYTTTSKEVSFGTAAARDAVIGSNVSFTWDGTSGFAYHGADAAAVESASVLSIGSSFALADGSASCSVANAAGKNAEGEVFAASATDGGRIDPAVFEDAYGAYTALLDGTGQAAWGASDNRTVEFKVGSATVARYVNAGSIDLSEVSALAERTGDQRQSYQLVGWSTSPDENATQGYTAADGSVDPAESTVYYAVYRTDLASVSLSFTNIFNAQGVEQDAVTLSGTYGQTVGDVLADAGAELPQPQDYTDADTGLRYKFVGWYAYTSTAPVSQLFYAPETVEDVALTVAVNGISSGSGLELRAVYAVAGADQHIITFKVDGYNSVEVVDDGAYPVYTDANASNPNYTVPAKQATEVGKTFTFTQWYDDADGSGTYDEGEVAYSGVLPRATEDATYTADWTWYWASVAYTFYIEYYDEDDDELKLNGVRTITTTANKAAQDVADGVQQVGSTFTYGGQVYTLDGWSTRKSDVEPVYDADNPLPNISSSNSSISGSYSATYYGVYSIGDQRAAVSFYDGDTLLGTSTVLAASTSIGAAFVATGASAPADKFSSEQFLGWALTPDATTALDSTSTLVSSLLTGSETSVSLYAVYGAAPVYTVRLRSSDGSTVLYKISVKRGRTVSQALADAGVMLSVPSHSGKYFKGFYTAANKYYSLDTAVTGSANLYATYGDVNVQTADSSDIDATTVTVLPSATGVTEELSDVLFSITSRGAAVDTPIKSAMAKAGYSVLKSYDIRLNKVNAKGVQALVTGAFGAANMKTYVGTKYRNAKVRVYWLGDKSGNETVMKSAVKTVSKKGYITVSIGNYRVGDQDEGGNLAVGYIEGGSAGSLSGGSSMSGTLSASGLSGSTIGASGLGGVLSGSGLTGSSSGGALKSGTSGTALSKDSASSSLSKKKSSSLKKSASAQATSSAKAKAASGDDSAAGSSNADGSAAGENADSSPFADWDSNAIVLVLGVAAVAAYLLRKLWVLFARRHDDDDEDAAPIEETYSKGIRF